MAIKFPKTMQLIPYLYNPKTCIGYAIGKVSGTGEKLIKYRTDPKTGQPVEHRYVAKRADYAMSAAVGNRDGRFPKIEHEITTEVW